VYTNPILEALESGKKKYEYLGVRKLRIHKRNTTSGAYGVDTITINGSDFAMYRSE
jgi:hypothetical protein